MLTFDRADILGEVIGIARRVFLDPSLEIEVAMTMDDEPNWDSMSHIALAVEVELRFGIEFALEDVEAIDSIGALVRMIETGLEQKGCLATRVTEDGYAA
jgi:acyl carrier protein